jgi:hypothetical protein
MYALYATSITICNSVTRATHTVNVLIDVVKNDENHGWWTAAHNCPARARPVPAVAPLDGGPLKESGATAGRPVVVRLSLWRGLLDQSGGARLPGPPRLLIGLCNCPKTREGCPVAFAPLRVMLLKWHREVFFNGRSSVN